MTEELPLVSIVASTPAPSSSILLSPTISHLPPTPHLWQKLIAEVVHLRGEAGARIHDQRPQLLAARHTADVQPVVVALLYVLLHARVGHVVMVPAAAATKALR